MRDSVHRVIVSGCLLPGLLLALPGCRTQKPGRECFVAEDCEDGDLCTEPRCDDEGRCHHHGIDSDGDGHAWRCGTIGDDCNDEDPAIHADATEICNDEKDNDCDGLTDCDDPDCADWPRCAGIEDCDNGEDDDGDQMVDCEDLDCLGEPHCCLPVPEICADGLDNDCDGLADCGDPDCASEPHCCVPVPEDCVDWVDNDCDRLIDCLDPDCYSSTACTRTPELCNDGLDNDADGLTDCDDPDCGGAVACGGAPCIPRANSSILHCGSGVITDNMFDTTTATQQYSCGPTLYAGPETVYAMRLEAGVYGIRPMLIHADVSSINTPVGSDIDLYVLRGQTYDATDPTCDPGQCVAWSSTPATIDEYEEVFFIGWPDITYYFVVDGVDAYAESGFMLRVECLALCTVEECANGIDDDCDGFVDCWDPDCQGSPACP